MILELLSKPWHWSFSGAMIALVMFLLLRSGGEFGVSSNLRTICAIGGGSKFSDFFKVDTKAGMWNLVFVGGAIFGGFLAASFLNGGFDMVSRSTIEALGNLGLAPASEGPVALQFYPELFVTPTLPITFILLLGGILVGFGARYAGGCTSGHAISGLANLQVPSLISVVGFFIGGLIMTWLILPAIFPLGS